MTILFDKNKRQKSDFRNPKKEKKKREKHV